MTAGSTPALPEHLFLRTRYHDPMRQEERERQYAVTGEVWAVNRGERSLLCTFDPDQVAQARQAIEESGLTATPDTAAGDVQDAAVMSYEWRLGDRCGLVVDSAYPAIVPESFDRLEDRLLELEQASRASG